MKKCYQSVINAATGRKLTKSEVQNIFDNIYKNQQRLAKQNPEWQTLSAEEKIRSAAELGANDVIYQKELKEQRIAQTIIARERIESAIDDIIARGVSNNQIEALNRLIAYRPDNKTGYQALDTRIKATRNWAVGQLVDAWDISKIFGLFEDEKGITDLVHEMYGENTGNTIAKQAATSWHNVTEQLRTTFNNAGGDIGKLDNWGLPQEHSQIKVFKAGEAQWINDILPEIDRSQYVHPDGQLMTDNDIKKLFSEMYDTISSGGINKLRVTGQKISSMRANRRNDARQIFFKNADSFLRYHKKYGDRGIFDIMLGHVSGISRDIALLETFGPNPNLMFRSLLDSANQETAKEKLIDPTKRRQLVDKTSNLYDFVAGNYKPAVPSLIARVIDTARNLLTAARLGSATLTAITDQGTLAIMAKTNGIALGDVYKSQLAALNPTRSIDRRFAQRNGLALESVTASLNRWGSDNMGSSWSSTAASTVLRLSGLMKISDAAKEGYATSMMSSVGHVVATNTDLATLHKTSKFDAELIKRHGVNETDFAIWKKAERTSFSGVDNILTPESIMSIPDSKIAHLGNPNRIKFEAARKLLGMLSEESDVAVVSPGTRDRVRLGSNIPRGTFLGEITRSVTQFKAFPFAVVARMWARGSSLPTGLQKSYFGGSLILGTTLMGAASLQLNNIASGKKTQEMNDIRFWVEAMLKGGALGVYGDFMFSDTNNFGQELGNVAIGPLGGSLGQMANLILGNTHSLLAGEETNFGEDAIKFIKGLTPGANLWYTKAVTDHLLFNQAQELVSPGYLRKVMKRQKTSRGTEYYWPMDKVLP